MLGFFFFQAEDGIRDLVRSRGLGDVYKRQVVWIGCSLLQSIHVLLQFRKMVLQICVGGLQGFGELEAARTERREATYGTAAPATNVRVELQPLTNRPLPPECRDRPEPAEPPLTKLKPLR
eukprot:TRINITY_DN9881_c0_g1_i4.p2 TRINITY_DN9881_c0_g1~~TRINITY_DN9881_c0_g1_i4.p2  ORF type:complete len:121 (-),score=14.48 TRINITY_DN9881_c0_g1_i4:566-928(-)